MKMARWRSLWAASGSVGAGLLLIAILIAMINYLGWKYHQRLDWTKSRFYSLSEKSLAVLESLEQKVEVIVFMPPGSELYSAITELLARYDAATGQLEVRLVDPERNPAQAQELLDRYDISQRTVVLESGDERRTVAESDLVDYDYAGMQFGQSPLITDFKGEQVFTGAILELIEKRKPQILFTSGHGEAGLDDVSPGGLSQARDFLGRDNFAMEEWPTLGKGSVPEGTDLVVVAGPRTAFVEPELDLLADYLRTGGRLILMLDPTVGDQGLQTSGFTSWLENWGVVLGQDIVVDTANPLPFYSAETFFANAYLDHPITEALDEAGYPVIFSLARTVGRSETGVEGARVTELIRSSPQAWGETRLTELSAVEKDPEDLEGPVSLAVAIELDFHGSAPETTAVPSAAETSAADDPELEVSSLEGEMPPRLVARPPSARLVVLGDSDFARNAQLAKLGNPTLLLNVMNWLVERENLLEIPAKEARQLTLSLARSELSSIYWFVLLILPGLSVGVGTLVYLRRRR